MDALLTTILFRLSFFSIKNFFDGPVAEGRRTRPQAVGEGLAREAFWVIPLVYFVVG